MPTKSSHTPNGADKIVRYVLAPALILLATAAGWGLSRAIDKAEQKVESQTKELDAIRIQANTNKVNIEHVFNALTRIERKLDQVLEDEKAAKK